jgi:large conductance mechanosensitive channel
MWKEFKSFAMKGNVIDMAIGVIIGTAFGKIVTSLVNDIIMPPLGLLIGNMDFSNLAITLASPIGDMAPVKISYGLFINNLVNFLIVAFAIFVSLRAINKLKKPEPAADPTTKACQFCQSVISIKATKCAFCTSAL